MTAPLGSSREAKHPGEYRGWTRAQMAISVCAVLYFAVVCIGLHNWLALGILASHAVALVGWASAQNSAAKAFKGWERTLDSWEECTMDTVIRAEDL